MLEPGGAIVEVARDLAAADDWADQDAAVARGWLAGAWLMTFKTRGTEPSAKTLACLSHLGRYRAMTLHCEQKIDSKIRSGRSGRTRRQLLCRCALSTPMLKPLRGENDVPVSVTGALDRERAQNEGAGEDRSKSSGAV